MEVHRTLGGAGQVGLPSDEAVLLLGNTTQSFPKLSMVFFGELHVVSHKLT
jgi:hypothetical protein